MGEMPFAISLRNGLQIVRGVGHAIAWAAVADFKNDADGVRPVLQMVGKAFGGKACDHPRGQLQRVIPSKQGGMTFQHIDKFILLRVRMMKRRKAPRGKVDEIHAKIFQIEQISQGSLGTAQHQGSEGLRVIAGAGSLWGVERIDRIRLSGASHFASLTLSGQWQSQSIVAPGLCNQYKRRVFGGALSWTEVRERGINRGYL